MVVRIAQVVGHLLVVAHTIQRYAVRGAHARIEEVLDVVLQSAVLVNQLLVVPDGTVDLGRTVQLGTPRTVLDERLGTVPTLTELILHLRQQADITPLNASVVADLEVALALLLTALGGDHDHTVGSAATIQSSSGSTLQNGHVLDVVRVDARQTTLGAGMTHSLTCGLLEGHTVNDIQGLVVTVDRADTADNHAAGSTRVA